MREAKIEVRLTKDGSASLWLDGCKTQERIITDEEDFVDFLEESSSDYWWWIAEAWRSFIEYHIENPETDEETDEDCDIM